MPIRLAPPIGPDAGRNLAWIGAALAAGFWVLESLLHAFVFGQVALADALVAQGDVNELWMRVIIALLFLGFGWGASRAVRSERRLRISAERIRRLVQFAGYLRMHETDAFRMPAGPLPLDLAVSEDDVGKLTRAIWDLSDFLEARFKELQALLSLTHQINMGLLLDDVLDKAYATLRSVLPYDRLSVALIEEDGHTVRARWARAEYRLALGKGFSAPLAGSSLQRLLIQAEPRIINDLVAYLDAHQASESTRLIVSEGICSSLTCPLISAGKPVGFMFFSSRTPRAFKNVHVEMFKLIAAHLSLVVEKSNLYEQLLRERDNAERLLLNVIPERIAGRLRAGEHPIVDAFPVMNILFADIVNFTTVAGRYPPRQILETLSDVFLVLDHLCDVHDVEKIKTIGDEYMAISTQAEPGDEALRHLAEFALDAVATVRKLRYPDGTPIELRLGLHTGTVVAGVISQKKFAYDIWGDAVNVASRMESHGESGRIHVTEAVQAKLAERFLFEERGSIEVKSKGPMKTYFLLGKKPPA